MVSDEDAVLFFKYYREMLDEAVGYWENGQRCEGAISLLDLATSMDGFVKLVAKEFTADELLRLINVATMGDGNEIASPAKERLYAELLERHAPTD